MFAPKPDSDKAKLSGAAGIRARSQIHPEDEDTVVERPGGVAEHGEVLVVDLHPLDEPAPVGAFERRDAPAAHCLGPLPESDDHGLDVELAGGLGS